MFRCRKCQAKMSEIDAKKMIYRCPLCRTIFTYSFKDKKSKWQKQKDNFAAICRAVKKFFLGFFGA